MAGVSAPSPTGRKVALRSENRVPAREDRATFASSRGVLTDVSWRPHSDLSFADWVEHGRRLGLVGRSAGWWIGDWLNFGNAAYGERYVRAARITGYDVQTLMNMTYVASRIEPDRRRERLSWSHHAEVAALDVPAQERWLERAEQDRLAVRCLREEIRRERRLASGEQDGLEPASEADADTPAAEVNGEARLVCPECGHAFAMK
jgi:hypothetical protein